MNPLIVIGGLIGFLFGRWGGLIAGAIAGWMISGFIRGSRVVKSIRNVQNQFLNSTFAVMGAVAKADGHVNAAEIRVAEQLFDRLHLSGAARSAAKDAFRRGKSPGFDLDAEVQRFRRTAQGQRPLLQMFLQIQLSAMAADGVVHPAEHAMLLRIARGLGLSELEIQQLEAMLRGGGQAGAGTGNRNAHRLEDDYRVLGVAPSASDADLKKAYRRLMSQNHPDKLAAKGLPESMREMAEEKTREITSAYERIKQSRGLH